MPFVSFLPDLQGAFSLLSFRQRLEWSGVPAHLEGGEPSVCLQMVANRVRERQSQLSLAWRLQRNDKIDLTIEEFVPYGMMVVSCVNRKVKVFDCAAAKPVSLCL